MNNLDDYHQKEYHSTDYNCSHFVRDLWFDLTGQDICDLVGAFNSGRLGPAMSVRRGLVRLDNPEDPCIVWFVLPGFTPHVGIFVERGVFHMTPDGPRYQPLALLQNLYQNTKFYKCQTLN